MALPFRSHPHPFTSIPAVNPIYFLRVCLNVNVDKLEEEVRIASNND